MNLEVRLSLNEIDDFEGELEEGGRHRHAEFASIVLFIKKKMTICVSLRFLPNWTKVIGDDFEENCLGSTSSEVWFLEIITMVGRRWVNRIAGAGTDTAS